MKKALKKFLVVFCTIVSAISLSFVVTAQARADVINENYQGYFYFSDMPNSGQYMYFGASDAKMHCILYNLSGTRVFLCADNPTSVLFTSDNMSVTYPSAQRTYQDGSYYSTILGPVLIYTDDIAQEFGFWGVVTKVTIYYNTYSYVK